MIACIAIHTHRAQTIHMVDLQNRILLDHAKEDKYSECRIEIERIVEQHQSESSANGIASGRLNRIVIG